MTTIDLNKKPPDLNPNPLNLLDDASDEFLQSIDKERFAIDPLYSKTILACLENDIPYSQSHLNGIAAIDEFISNKKILDVIVSIGDYPDAGYGWVEEEQEWIYIIPYPNDGYVAVVDAHTISIRKAIVQLTHTTNDTPTKR
tara:strand:+ start:1027 stop:1452 length:426 start_codon:yes stop_codon:yes gene_type:complete